MTKTVKTKRELNGNRFEVTLEKGVRERKLPKSFDTVTATVENLKIKVGGKTLGTAKPTIINIDSPLYRGPEKKAYEAGRRYRIDNGGCIGAYIYDASATLIIEMIEEVGKLIQSELSEETIMAISEIEKAENGKNVISEKNMMEIEKMENRIEKSWLCPKCGSFCYGDCDAN